MSASDLVPRVVLFVSDLERENDKLKSQLKEQESQLKEQEDERLLVQITGPNRTPIHYEDSLKHGYTDGVGGQMWRLIFGNNIVFLPLSSSFTALEIWLDGIFIDNFQNVDRLNPFNFVLYGGVDRTEIGYVTFSPGGVTRQRIGPVHIIYARIGPMTYADCKILMDEQLDLEEQIALCSDPNFMIESIMFRKDKISGIMSLVEKLGISTSNENNDGGDDNDDDENRADDIDEETSDNDEDEDDDDEN